MRRLRYWEQAGLVVPSIRRRLGARHTIRLYGYQDLLALLVVAALRTDQEMSLQKIRRVVGHLRSRGYQAPDLGREDVEEARRRLAAVG